ncbi:hypothetical protein [Streptomyces subrutilus]|uniref:Uncharacterized protein n=1 Tax=Streptomyces subrutilus TaxID=36818 RepID=A0A5P2UK34_9ACTN|nr:hypothetical protein [Streptomyces subrutilus]QEU79656.1 hypothetical protein CP968_16135 [Streptomyces subrutilus]
MNRTKRRHLTVAVTAVAALTAGLVTSASAAEKREGDRPALTAPAADIAAARSPNYSCGTETGSDRATADRLSSELTGTLRGYLTSYRVSCARAIVNAVQARGLSQRAAVIAVTTAIVESTLYNNPNMIDLDSVGLFQQRASWGSFDQRMNPAWSTNAFLNQLVKQNNWQTRPIGELCQAVQISAYPDRYQTQAADAQRIVGDLWSPQTSGDAPVAGNWDGGPAANVGVFRPSTGQFHLRYDDGTLTTIDWGQTGDLPVSANWDGTGPDNLGVFRPSTGQFHLRNDNGTLTILDWGQTGDLPVAANWDGGAASNIGIWRNGTFHLRNDNGTLTTIDWGQTGDLPVTGNWDGTGPDNLGVFRPSTGQFHLRNDNGTLTILDWGQTGDLPVAANWDGGNGAPAANIGIWRPSQGRFHLRNDNGTLTTLDWGQPR